MLTYVASPYTHEDPKVMQSRYEAVMQYVADMMQEDERVRISSIIHHHPMAVAHVLPRSAEFWQRSNRVLLKACSHMEILCLDGWEESEGIKLELLWAREFEVPYYYVMQALDVRAPL
ncbi:MAG: DUF1937 family protein [Deltaproteobacteria bacterium]|nr:DUF1937 family protein [Deltaproteobacteria bacterium]